jgi:hypothetical protein
MGEASGAGEAMAPHDESFRGWQVCAEGRMKTRRLFLWILMNTEGQSKAMRNVVFHD